MTNYKKKKNEAHEYYVRAKATEERFKELYGTHTGLSETKRAAILAHEPEAEAQKLLAAYAPKKQPDQKLQQLIQSGILNTSYPPNPKSCSRCAAAHVKDKPDTPLLACGACRSIWYCSRECQVADFKSSHKNQCKQLQAAKATEQK